MPLIVNPKASHCDVCFENYNATVVKPVVLPCGHFICGNCAFSVDHRCPLCRARFASHQKTEVHLDYDSSSKRRDRKRSEAPRPSKKVPVTPNEPASERKHHPRQKVRFNLAGLEGDPARGGAAPQRPTAHPPVNYALPALFDLLSLADMQHSVDPVRDMMSFSYRRPTAPEEQVRAQTSSRPATRSQNKPNSNTRDQGMPVLQRSFHHTVATESGDVIQRKAVLAGWLQPERKLRKNPS